MKTLTRVPRTREAFIGEKIIIGGQIQMSAKEKTLDFFEKIRPVIDKMGQNDYLQTISGAMMNTLGPVMVGSIAVILLAFPIEGVKNAIAAAGLTPILAAANSLTIGCLALYVAYLIAKIFVERRDHEMDGTMAGILSIMCFLIMTPLGKTDDLGTVIPTKWLGASGVFSAMIIAFIVANIFIFFKKKGWTIKMPEGVPPMVSKSFESLLSSIVIGLLFLVLSWLFSKTPAGSLHQLIYTVIQMALQGIGGSLPATILTSFLMQLLWFFGIHGTNVIAPIVTPIRMALDVQNQEAMVAGAALPNIVGNAFFSIVCWGGSALGLVMLMLKSKSKRFRELGKVAVVPALFGITEPVIFGTPLVFNFTFFIPFVFNNSINLLLSYFLTAIGVVHRCAGIQPIFGLPLGFHAMVGGHWTIIVLQLVIQLVLSPIEWYPWFKMAEKQMLIEEAADSESEEK